MPFSMNDDSRWRRCHSLHTRIATSKVKVINECPSLAKWEGRMDVDGLGLFSSFKRRIHVLGRTGLFAVSERAYSIFD